VHGPVIDLFECSDKLYTAVEVTAGNQLFNVVVDTDVTASKLYALLSQHKAGRVTCLPINRLNVSTWHSAGNAVVAFLSAACAQCV
jgi:structural maintenance of chromosome 3 (chondroitin sulfate proteoglycan 6)